MALHKTVVINAVGLTPQLIGAHTPRLRAFADAGALGSIEPVLPAVTCSVQSTYLTGAWPSEHGIVGNGWYFREQCEVRFWHQSDRLVQRPRIWDAAKALDPQFTCANLFWWYAMYSGADYPVTPRPMYPADGRKIPDVWTSPGELRDTLQERLGRFPLFEFWGPMTSINATRWIVDASILIDQDYNPTLSLVYLPHLDYNFQRLGPNDPRCQQDLRELDAQVGRLLDHFAARDARVLILSEYGIVPVSRPVHLNRILRQMGLIQVREELGRELLDAGASRAFAVADHQVAHVYVNDPACLSAVRSAIERIPGVARVLDQSSKPEAHLDHPRSGELVALAEPDAWFTYYYWLDDARAPDFARTVDIHRKPGYDPVELFIDPAIRWPKARVAATLLKRRLGSRALMQLTPLDASLVRGSHGLVPQSPRAGPLLLTSRPDLVDGPSLAPTAVHKMILRHLSA